MRDPVVGALPASLSAQPARKSPVASATLWLLVAGGLAVALAGSVAFRADLLVAGLLALVAAAVLPGVLSLGESGRSATEAWRDTVERAIDVALASVAVVLLLPLLAIAALAVKLGDGGPVIFRQRRVGLNGELFSMYKFRSMRPAGEACEATPGVIEKTPDDERITAVGRVLRRTSLDELPQLVNILLGHMSIVGPRPLPPCEAAVVPDWAVARWGVRPGLTCYWQVGGRSDIAWEERMEMDVRYVQDRSLSTDARLIARTFEAVVSGRGAY